MMPFESTNRCLKDITDLIRSRGMERTDSLLPQIVTLVDRSVDESCLEDIFGKWLPPRNGAKCTLVIPSRTPLEVRMRTSTEGTRYSIQYITNGELVENEVRSQSELAQAIRDAQMNMWGHNCERSDSLITLNVQSPDVSDLTVTDISKLIRHSQESPSIEQQRIEKYIKSEQTVMVVVFKAGMDIETVPAFRLAWGADRELNRTMGVIMYTDRPDCESVVTDCLTNTGINLKLGLYAIKQGSQKDVEKDVALIRANRIGQQCSPESEIRLVRAKLDSEMTTRMKGAVLEIRRIVHEYLNEIKKKLEKLGEDPTKDGDDRTRKFLSLLSNYTDTAQAILTGDNRNHDKTLLVGLWRKESEKFATFIEDLTDKEIGECSAHRCCIRAKVEEQRGNELSGFNNIYPVCEKIIKDIQVKWREPVDEYVSFISNLVADAVRDLASETFERYPKLGDKVKEVVYDQHQKASQEVETGIQKVFLLENIVWTQDSAFKEALDAVKDSDRTLAKVLSDDYISEQVEHVLDAISAYLKVARQTFVHIIPKYVFFHLLEKLSGEIKTCVLSAVFSPKAIEELYIEREDIAKSRQVMTDEQRRWQNAASQLARVG